MMEGEQGAKILVGDGLKSSVLVSVMSAWDFDRQSCCPNPGVQSQVGDLRSVLTSSVTLNDSVSWSLPFFIFK